MGLQLRHLYNIQHNIVDEAVKIYEDKAKSSKKPLVGIMADFDMTHTGAGINNRLYGQSEVMRARKSICMKDGAGYDIPLLVNHDTETKPLGRFRASTFQKFKSGPKNFDWSDYAIQRLNRFEGLASGVLRGHCNIIDAQTIDDVLTGIYTTTSVGMRIESFMCSIHDKDGEFHELDPWDDEKCGHMPGDMIGRKLCLAIAQNMMYKEQSFVNAPADSSSGVVRIGEDKIMDMIAKDNDNQEMIMEGMNSPLDFYLVGDKGEITYLDSDRYESNKEICRYGGCPLLCRR